MEKHSSGKKRKKKSSGRSVIRVVAGFSIVFFVMLTGIGCGFLTASINTRPDISEDIIPSASSHIYDVDGREIAIIHATENREPVKLAQIPKNLQDAFIAVEDARFYDHIGIDPRGILRALVANVVGGGVSEGGSTITQQLAKNAYLTQERTMKRKVQEMFLALQLERKYTKQEILEIYLNQIYFGQGAYGVQAAAKTYFGKNVEDLDINESAMLAGIPKSPNYYSPLNNLEAAKERKSVVLSQMAKYGYIDQDMANELKNTDVKLVKKRGVNEASYFIDYVLQTLIEMYGADAVYKEGLKIYTTIDMDMQRAAEAAMKMLPNFETDENGIVQPQGALVAIDLHNGQIRAMVGGRGTDQFNRATLAVRQPGSAFKPFVFAAALESKFSPDTIIDDSPITIGDWSPENYSRRFNGKVNLRTVATNSLNVPTVKIAQKIGIDKAIFYAQEMGITTFVLEGPINDRNLATSLGGLTRGVTPLEITSAYGTFANDGVHVEPVSIIKVLDRNGATLHEAAPKSRQVIGEAVASELTGMLQNVVAAGTGTGASIGRPAAGKTGTTSDYHDAWFVGYTPDMVAGVWVGCDDNSDLDGMTGGELPASIWRSFMSEALSGTPVSYFSTISRGNADSIREVVDDNAPVKVKQPSSRDDKRGKSNPKPVEKPKNDKVEPERPSPSESARDKYRQETEKSDNPVRPSKPTTTQHTQPIVPAAPAPVGPGPGSGKGKN